MSDPDPTPGLQGQEMTITSGGVDLDGYLARPAGRADHGAGRRGMVLCHGFPITPSQQQGNWGGYMELADRLAVDTSWSVLTFSFRGTGRSGGNFSLRGWLEDLEAAIEALRQVPGVEDIWLCGFAAGGALAICAAGEDPKIRGVATFAAPADFGDRAGDAKRFVDQARALGIIRDPDFPPDLDEWARELREVRPLSLIAKLPPRPVMLVHGANDEVVPVIDARALQDAADSEAELRILSGAGHRIRHDPRAMAILLGWMDRQP